MEIKNIANYEMDFDADEIMERFVRGIGTIHRGPGLGLAIARSFTLPTAEALISASTVTSSK